MTSQDIQVRIWLLTVKLSELGNEYADDLRLGKKCSLKHRNDIILLEAIIELLNCIDVYDWESNCYTEKEIKALFDMISERYDICFSPWNMYQDYFRITTDGDIRETVTGDSRIYI